MIIHVRFYSEFSEAYGKEEQSIVVLDNSSVHYVISELKNKKPQLALDVERILKNTIILVNGTISTVDTELKDNDLISILPFITGG